MPTPEQFSAMIRLIAESSDALLVFSNELKVRTSDGLRLVNGSETYGVPITQEMVTAIMTVSGPRLNELIAQIKTAANQLP